MRAALLDGSQIDSWAPGHLSKKNFCSSRFSSPPPFWV